MHMRTLQGLAATLRGKSAMSVDRILREHQLSAEERICVKHMLTAQTTQEHLNEMHAASGEAPRAVNEAQRLLARVGFQLGRWYSTEDVNRLLQASDLDPSEKIACRIELTELRMTGEAEDKGHELRASAARSGRLLIDRRGRPVVIRATAE